MVVNNGCRNAPVTPDEVGSPHAPGAILMKGVLTESLVSPANPILDYFVF